MLKYLLNRIRFECVHRYSIRNQLQATFYPEHQRSLLSQHCHLDTKRLKFPWLFLLLCSTLIDFHQYLRILAKLNLGLVYLRFVIRYLDPKTTRYNQPRSQSGRFY